MRLWDGSDGIKLQIQSSEARKPEVVLSTSRALAVALRLASDLCMQLEKAMLATKM